jgi:SAM-dependent methyltransferase
MEDPDGYFGERVASTYDDSSHMFQPGAVEPTVSLLAELAGDGRALELAVGTGRIALPLAARGIPVHGIDLSRAMVARMRAKPGGDAIDVTIGDFATTRVPGTFRLAYLVFNTIMNLTTQDAQVACFQNVAEHLEPGGCFVIEVGVPPLRMLPPGQNVLRRSGCATPTTSRRRRVRGTTSILMTAAASTTRSRSGTSGQPNST